MKDFNQFREEHPILLNSILIALAAVAVVYIALLFIDVFTAHGEECRVPNVRNMSLEQAIEYIDSDELLEVTPESFRIRKKILDPLKRKRAMISKQQKAQG